MGAASPCRCGGQPRWQGNFTRERRAGPTAKSPPGIGDGESLSKNNSGILRSSQTIKFGAIDRQDTEFPVLWMCRKLSVSASGFYRWRTARLKKKPNQDGFLILTIKALHRASRGAYGSPRIHRALQQEGHSISCRRVAHLMRESGLRGRTRCKKTQTTVSDPTHSPAPNTLDRDFDATKVNQKWVTDITYLSTKEGWVYLAAIIDLFSRRVVGYSLADNMQVKLALDAMNNAITNRQPMPGLIHHSDRGSQYTSRVYRDLLTEHGFICSMSRRGQCWDNSVAESFFGRLKEELMPHGGWETRADAVDAVSEYIDCFYNLQRIQKRLGCMSPVGYELLAASAQVAA